MQITIETTALADPDLSLGLIGPAGLTLNGSQIVDDAQFFRAAAPSFFLRGGVGTVLQFTVTRLFATLRKAEAFALQHWANIPRNGLVTVTVGEGADTQALYLRNAVLEAIAVQSHRGLSVMVQYTIRGGQWESDIPPEDIPPPPGPGETSPVIRRGKVTIAAGVSSIDVAFSSPTAAVPVVTATISRPGGGDAIWPIIRKDSVTVNGFTADLSGATADATYDLNYIAIE